MNKTVLVIGGCGFIGRNLVPRLVDSGWNVIVLGRSPSLIYQGMQNVDYIHGDFSSGILLESLLDRVSDIIHLAYATVPNTSFNDPLADLNQNLPPTLQLFSLAAKKSKKIIFLSSGGTVYGQSECLPITESHQTHPISPYGLTKLTIENYARLFSLSYGLEYICLRPSNAYGIGQKPFLGQGFISTAVASIINKRSVTLYGEIGTVRDYLYINDLANAVILTLDKGKSLETYNIGSGIGFSNMEVLEILKPIMSQRGYSINVRIAPERVFDVRTNILDSSKFQKETGWKPQTDLKFGLQSFVDWILSESSHN